MSTGPYRDHVYQPKEVDKTKWIVKTDFKTAIGKLPEFWKDARLPDFLNGGLAYVSTNKDIVSQKIREKQVDKFVCAKDFSRFVKPAG